MLGNAAIPDQAKLDTFRFWALSGGTDQPPGAWLQVAESVSADRGLSLEDTTRLFALQTMAMADTVAPTYKSKLVHHRWRPITAIRNADDDNNPNTDEDATWLPRAGGNPPDSPGTSPEHWSGHSSFSAAGATVLGRFFCNDQIPFTLLTDSAPGGQPRSYSRFSQAANEAGRSRVFGGLHFEFSNQAGLGAGRAIADEVLSKELLVTKGATHQGACPL